MHDKKEVFEAAQRLILEQQRVIDEQNQKIRSLEKEIRQNKNKSEVDISETNNDIWFISHHYEEIKDLINLHESKKTSWAIRRFILIQSVKIRKRDILLAGINKISSFRFQIIIATFVANSILFLHFVSEALSHKEATGVSGVIVFLSSAYIIHERRNQNRQSIEKIDEDINSELKKR